METAPPHLSMAGVSPRVAQAAMRHSNISLTMDESLSYFEELADIIGRGLLIVAGYHQHNRSEWRKRNEQDRNASDRQR